MKQIKGDTSIWRGIPCFLYWKNQYCEMTTLLKTIYRFNEILIKLPLTFFTELEQASAQFVWRHKRPWIVKAIWQRKLELEESGFLTSDNTTKLQSLRQYGPGTKTEIMTNGTRLKSPKITLHTYGHLILREKTESSIGGAGETRQLNAKESN